MAGTLRAAKASDADSILDLNLLNDLVEFGEPNTTIDEVNNDLATDGMAAAVVEGEAGELLGYAWAEYQAGHEKSWGDFIVRPGADPAVSPVLLEWLESTAAQLAPGLPLHAFSYEGNHSKRALYEAAGGTVIRRSYRMVLTFASRVVVPSPASGVVIRPIEDTDADLRAMHAVVDVAFLDHFAHESEAFDVWLKRSRGYCPDLSLWWLATVDGEPAAGVYASDLPESGYVDTLGTLRAFRGLGLGRQLLLTSFAEFQRRGHTKVVLGVDATNPTGALQLYESVGMKADHVGLRYELHP